jgi:outer membrane protein TolC
MSTSIKIISSFIVLLFASVSSYAQAALDNYVAAALKNNDGVKEQQFQLEKSILALREARTLFLPAVALQGDYTKAQGGRTIDLPIGDLLNPAYSSLNQLTHSDNFPMLKNESILLNPDNFYDVKFHTTMPLINSEIYYNKQIKKQSISLQQASVNVYKRALVKDVKTAYFLYYQARQSVAIYKDALQLVEKNIAVNESLLKNGVRNSTALTRAETEKEKVLAQITQAGNNSKNAQAYFNFLLNRSLDAAIDYDTTYTPTTDLQPDLNDENKSVAGREELQQLAIKEDLFGLNKKLEQSYMIPKLNTFLDLGSQGFNWTVDNESRYYFFGVNLQWDLFAWGQHTDRIRQAQMDVSTTAVQYDETEKSFRLALTRSLNDYNSSVSNYYSARSQQQYAEKYFTDQMKAYKEGQLLYIELLDAQNQLTTAQLQLSLAFANVEIAKAETERNLATYPLN